MMALLLLIAGPGAAARAQAPPAGRSSDAESIANRLAGRLDPATLQAVTRLIDSAEAAGVPAGPLVSKALEGASKHATADRIGSAVRNLATDLASARTALGVEASEVELVAAAGALRSGVAPDALARVKLARPGQSALVPFSTLADLAARGVPVDSAVSAVLALARRGAADRDYHTLESAGESGGSAGGSSPGGGTGGAAGRVGGAHPGASASPSPGTHSPPTPIVPPNKGRPPGRP
jgi:hypothetical protein